MPTQGMGLERLHTMSDSWAAGGQRFLLILCFMLWPFVGGAAGLALLVLVVFALMGGHYGELVLLAYGPVAVGLLLVAALLRAAARKLAVLTSPRPGSDEWPRRGTPQLVRVSEKSPSTPSSTPSTQRKYAPASSATERVPRLTHASSAPEQSLRTYTTGV